MIGKIKSTTCKTLNIFSDGSLYRDFKNCNLKNSNYLYSIKDFKKYQLNSKTKLSVNIDQVDGIKKFRKLFLNK
jgi:hypothetical protein